MKTIAVGDNCGSAGIGTGALRTTLIRMSSYFSAQSVVQLANVATGFLLIRSLPKTEYAWFMIVTGAMATISVLADSGLGSAFTSLGGKTYQDQTAFAGLCQLIRRKRLQFLFLSSGVTLPLSAWALHKNGASAMTTTSLLALVLLVAVAATDAVVLTTVNKLFNRIRNLVVADLTLSLAKLSMIATVCFLGASAAMATVCVLMATWLQFALLRRQTSDILVATHNTDGDEHRGQINSCVAHVLPISIFTCFQAQIATYTLSYFASSSEVADLGALMRLSVAFTFLSLPLQQIFLPRIARCQDRPQLRVLISRIYAGFAFCAVLVVATGYLLAPYLLWLLGPNYIHLRTELLLFLGVSALGFFANAIWSLVFTRGWVFHSWIHIPMALGMQAVALMFLDLTNVSGVILFSAVSHSALLIVGSGLVLTGFRREFST